MQHHPQQHHPHPLNPHPPIPHHHHQNSLSHYPSPPNGHSHQQHVLQGSPAGQLIAPHYQQQLLKCEMVRSCRSPHHRARASQMASRPIAKSAIPITNPNAPPEVPSETASSDTTSEASPALANHPSSTVGPVTEAPRPTASRPPANNWNSLDMGGINIKHLPPSSGLFSYSFLINLYLNHNALTSVPPEISKLRHLEMLDLSGNLLTVLPPELGMLTFLKELFVFDNMISTIPHELGTLHQLQTLGVEGNPLEATFKSIIQKDGTAALISYLRDSCPVPPPPPERHWKSVVTDHEREFLSGDPAAETFSVLCYNILCEKYATERLYGYTPAWALQWDFRKEIILNEIISSDADFMCLQEVDIAQYEDYFTQRLRDKGYEGVYWPKSRYKTMGETERRQVDGCATFYKASKYQLVEKHLIEFSAVAMQRQDFKKTDDMFNRVLGKDHIAVICLMENKQTGTRFIIANAHIHWDPAYRDVKLVQVALLLEEVEKIANNFARYPPRLIPTPAPTFDEIDEDGDPNGEQVNGETNGINGHSSPPLTFEKAPTYADGTKIPLIVCGDFNTVPDSGLYEFLSKGSLPANHPDFMSHMYGRYTSEGLKHQLGLKSAYDVSSQVPGATVNHASAASGASYDFPMTNFTPSFKGVIDYVWYSQANIAVNAVLGEVDKAYLEKVVGFPNAHFPSDHLCLIAEFRVKPPRQPS
ncbi:glucose-repressible alcohol dehydrogenase transcriptional effector [Pleurotus eryngii]|uniref:CCR4-Not complex 3'-5'-exoribonuclease subunit Ccr4 n=1 Tax=Pleurotus eryngii TaxID=5323 RepID=A0A9P6A844_PLEER|nr:glucose-repressible alcohol dehydrogenase transcriptional effector [Pleurotus eryngii]